MAFDLVVSNEYIRAHEDEIRIILKLWLNDMMLCEKCNLTVIFRRGKVNTNYYACPMHSEIHAKTIGYAILGNDIVQEFIEDYICWVYKQGVS